MTDELALNIRELIVMKQALAIASELMLAVGLPIDEPSNRREMDRLLERMPGPCNVADARTSAREKIAALRCSDDSSRLPSWLTFEESTTDTDDGSADHES